MYFTMANYLSLIPHVTYTLFTSSLFKDIHAPILNLWGVKVVVIAAFFAFMLASIVSCASFSFCNLFWFLKFNVYELFLTIEWWFYFFISSSKGPVYKDRAWFGTTNRPSSRLLSSGVMMFLSWWTWFTHDTVWHASLIAGLF